MLYGANRHYFRLFLPPGSDDVSHDEALSSRIAAVNLLDLGLGHLGVEVGRATREVEALVKACGQSRSFSRAIETSHILMKYLCNSPRAT